MLGRGILRLMPDSQSLEEQYFKDTRIYPLMHLLVLKSAVLDAHLWVGMNLVKAFLEAKTRSIQRLSDVTASHAPVVWMDGYTSRMRSIFGDDFFPYGIGTEHGGEINCATLTAFLKVGFELGVYHRLLDVEELFPKQLLASYKV